MMARLRKRLGTRSAQPAPAGGTVQTLSDHAPEPTNPQAPHTRADRPVPAEGLVALTDLPVGRAALVVRLAGGHGMQGRLASMGLHVGSQVRLLHAPRGSGPALVGIGQTRLAIGRGMAERILVSPVPAK